MYLSVMIDLYTKMILVTLVTTTLLIIGLVLVVASLSRKILILQNVKKIPGPRSKNWLVGNIFPLFDAPEKWFKVIRKWGRDYYPIYQNNAAFFFAAVSVLDPNDVEEILSNSKHNEKSEVYDMMHEWLGTGLLTSGGSKWHTRRKILTPAFHFNVLQNFISIFKQETAKLVGSFMKECSSSHVINITNHISEFTLNTIGETAMGVNFDNNNFNGQQYKEAVQQISDIYNYKLIRPLLTFKLIYIFCPMYYKEKRLVNILHKFTKSAIATRVKKIQSADINSYSRGKRLAMLDLLLTAQRKENIIDDEGIREEVDTFTFEGHDTSSAAICFALMLIACHYDIQNRIVEEMKEVFQDDAKLDYQNLQKLEYLGRCLKEVLRLYPSVPFISRVLGEDMVTHSGYHLKAGSIVHLHIYDLHHNPDLYPDPDRFDPDRFLPENCQNRHNFAFVPFSAGPRNCIGQKFAILEMKTVVCGILNDFILEPVDTPSTVVLKSEVVLRTKNGIRVKFVPRMKRIINFDAC